MARRHRSSALERWEVALVKAMLNRGAYNDQEILAYFTRPTRSVNHRVIGEIRTEAKHKALKPATDDELNDFLATWPNVDTDTGLNLQGDELLIKSREAMIAAVHTFNGAGLTFRTELFIVTAIIAWTYLLHAWLKREGIDFRYDQKTKQGADKYWDLGKCLRHAKCPLPPGVKKNLKFLVELRHEIEHRCTSRVDDTVGAELQACCINFNDALKSYFGAHYGLERRLPIALQFVSFGADQRALLKRATTLPPHIDTFINTFKTGLTEEQLQDPAFRMRVAFVPITSNRASRADRAIEFVRPGSEEAREVTEIILKEVNKRRYVASEVIKEAREGGYTKFNMHHHTKLWQSLNAKNSSKGYGCKGDYRNTWVWYESWIERVLEHCKENEDKYM